MPVLASIAIFFIDDVIAGGAQLTNALIGPGDSGLLSLMKVVTQRHLIAPKELELWFVNT
jgi:hypothetical protein